VYKPPTGKLCQVFISHAGEHRRGFVASLREEFRRSYPALEVFVDEHSLKVEGSAMPAIEAALQDAFVGATLTATTRGLSVRGGSAVICLPHFIHGTNTCLTQAWSRPQEAWLLFSMMTAITR
jgi:hypothetical protein